MNKNQRYFIKVKEYKDRFNKLPTEKLIKRLNDGCLIKEASVAFREILKERENSNHGHSPNGFQP